MSRAPPRVVHQIWMQGAALCPRSKSDLASQPWGPDVKHHLWDERAISALVDAQYSPWKSLWHSIQSLIIKCDVARAFILHAYGGIYADIDYEPSDGHKDAFNLVLGRDVVIGGYQSILVDRIPNNAWIAAVPRAPFWTEVFLPHVAAHLAKPPLVDILGALLYPPWTVLSVAGPVAFWRWRAAGMVDVVPRELVYAEFGVHARVKTGAWFGVHAVVVHVQLVVALLVLATIGAWQVGRWMITLV